MVALASGAPSVGTMSDHAIPSTGTPRRRRPTLWDVSEPQYGIPIPPPGQPAQPRASMANTVAVPAPNGSSSTWNTSAAVVGPPPPHAPGPLAGIDIAALRALLSPATAPLAGGLTPSGTGSGPGGMAGGHLSAASALDSNDAPLGSQQHPTRHARRLYVGNLPVNTTDVEVGDFFNRALAYSKGVEGDAKPVLSVYLNLEKRFAFIELRSLSEAAAALAMDGVLFSSMSLRMRRPNDYNEAACPPVLPPPHFDPSLLGIVSTQVGDGPNKVFIGGIPYSLTEDEVKVILQTHGRLAAFNMIKDAGTGTSKGFAFFEYADPSVVDDACKNLNGTVIENKTLTVRRATQHGERTALGSGGSVGDAGRVAGADGSVAAAALLRQVTRIVQLQNVVTEQELEDDEDYQDIVDETEEEARRFGALEKVVVPRPGGPSEPEAIGVGRVFIVFEKAADAERAFTAMDGRKFENRTVVASYVSEEDFAKGAY
jgi:splicing factor U2AF 65 kDa subunit